MLNGFAYNYIFPILLTVCMSPIRIKVESEGGKGATKEAPHDSMIRASVVASRTSMLVRLLLVLLRGVSLVRAYTWASIPGSRDCCQRGSLCTRETHALAHICATVLKFSCGGRVCEERSGSTHLVLDLFARLGLVLLELGELDLHVLVTAG